MRAHTPHTHEAGPQGQADHSRERVRHHAY